MDDKSEVVQTTVEAVASVTESVANETKSILHLDEITNYFTWENLVKVITSCIAILIFYVAYRIIKKVIKKQTSARLQLHTAILVNKVVTYVFRVLIIMYILSLFGINLSAIWGAAGVAGLAIGFAAQTSVSNIISSIFVISEKAMKVGDFINIDDMSGTVDSIDLLSIKIHTLDNQMVRIPNSTIMNGTLTNYSHFPIRRLVFDISVSYDVDMEKTIEAIKKVAGMCPTVLTDPEPAVYYDGLLASGILIKLCVWIKGADLLQTKTDVYTNVIKVTREEGIEIPYDHLEVNLHNNGWNS
ncbi:MAG: mechanosensitive ion channel family protein [Treponema sp.]|nr:mechanosensitive ion channel family protein [Treponema sp.]